MGFKKISLYVLAFALFYAFFERSVLRVLWMTFGVWENFLVKIFKTKVCLSHVPINALIRKRMIKLVAKDCHETSELLELDVFDMNDFKSQAELCPKLAEIGTSRPWVVRNFHDVSKLNTKEILEANRDLPVYIMNKTGWTDFVNERVLESEHGRGCSWLRTERRFRSTVGEWLDLTANMPMDHQYYVAFDWHMANMVYDHVQVKDVCGHKLERSAVDAFLTRKKGYLTMMDLSRNPEVQEKLGDVKMADTSPHCAAESNHFFMLSGLKKWVMVDPAYSPELALMHDNLHQNAAVLSPFLVKCMPRYEFNLHPGDLLYVPPWWFHEVYNIPENGDEGSLVFGMATRYLEAAGAAWYHPLATGYKYMDDIINGRITTTDAQNNLLGANNGYN